MLLGIDTHSQQDRYSIADIDIYIKCIRIYECTILYARNTIVFADDDQKKEYRRRHNRTREKRMLKINLRYKCLV